MNFGGKLFQWILLSLSLSLAASAQTVLTDDSFTSSATPKLNYGSSISLVVTSGSNSYLKFSLASLPAGVTGSNISGASAVLFVDAVLKSGTIDVYALNSPWSENSLTYNTAPPLGSLLISGVSVSQTGYLSFDLTPVVQKWVNTPSSNYGIALVPSPGSPIAISFDSKESILTSHPAQLNLSLVSMGPQGPQGMQGPPGQPGLAGPQGATGPQGPMPAGAALTRTSNTFTGDQTVNGKLIVSGGVQFADGTSLTSASTSAPASGSAILSSSPVVPPGYSLIGTTTLGNTWSEMAPMPTPGEDLAATTVNGKIYAIGGADGYNTVEVYEPSSNTWSSGAPMPTPRSELAATAVNGKIYAIGGVGGPDAVEVYDPSSNSWSTAAPMPTPKYGLAAAVVNGKIYAIGGFGGSSTVEVYDPSSNTWTTAAPMPTPRYGLAATVVNGKIYAIGGVGGSSTVEVYDPSSNSWSTAAPMPTPRNELAAAVVNGKIYAIGGGNNTGPSNTVTGPLSTVDVYDPASNTWGSAAPMLLGRFGLAAADVNGFIYAIGGDGPSGITGDIEQYQPSVTLYTYLKN